MGKAIELIFKTFNHLAREIQIYLLSGSLIVFNALAIDYFYYDSTLFYFIQSKSLLIPLIIMIYIIGHFCMAFYYTVLEWKEFDKKINKFLGLTSIVKSEELPGIYNKNPEIFLHFIERYVVLTMMRWTISSACCINFLIDIVFILKKNYYWQFLFTTILFAIGAIAFYLLTAKTEKDYAERIDSLKDN